MYPNQIYSFNRPGRPNRPNFGGNDRIGFLGPFILGGITGGLVSPLFYGNNYGYNRPQYYYYQPGPYYGPYPYRPF